MPTTIGITDFIPTKIFTLHVFVSLYYCINIRMYVNIRYYLEPPMIYVSTLCCFGLPMQYGIYCRKLYGVLLQCVHSTCNNEI